jgi:F-type H+-transporting ATPase subunit delta
VDLVLLPSTTGDFGVMPGHVPTVAQLRPGVITVHKELDKVGHLAAGPGGKPRLA